MEVRWAVRAGNDKESRSTQKGTGGDNRTVKGAEEKSAKSGTWKREGHKIQGWENLNKKEAGVKKSGEPSR